MTFNKQISFIVILSFTLICAQNTQAMRCAIKPLTLAYKVHQFKALPFCSKSEKPHPDLKKLQHIYDSLKSIEPNCFDAVTKGYGCERQSRGTCCLWAKDDAEQAKKGKHKRLLSGDKAYIKNLSKYIDERAKKDKNMHLKLRGKRKLGGIEYIKNLRYVLARLSALQKKNEKTHTIVASSQDKEVIEPLHKKVCELTKNISECLTYSANIYGITSYDASGHYYAKNPRGLFDSTKHMTKTERKREQLQNQCNRINKALMKSNGYLPNQNILLGWGAHTLDPEYIGAWLDGIGQAMRDHDDYVKNGGGVY